MTAKMKTFQTSHIKAFQLEQAIQDERFNFITEFEHGAKPNSDWFISKAKYILELSAELSQETDKMHSILANIEQVTSDVKEAEEITENMDGSPSTCDEVEVSSSYNESICTEHSFQTVKTAPPKSEPVMAQKRILRLSAKDTFHKDNSGYKYGGKGFKVFTGYRNQCKPIYSTTALVCHGTKDVDTETLREALIAGGRFTSSQIVSIFEQYNKAVIKVRMPLKSIKNKMRQFNAYSSETGLSISFKQYYNNTSANVNNVLFVNNFDITNKQMHKRFTNCFLRYGVLAKDIRMGLDKNKDPFAIVHFRYNDDAQRCVESELLFGGKKLSINYSNKM